MPSHRDLWGGQPVKTYASAFAAAAGIKTSIATLTTAVTYSGAALNGANVAILTFPQGITATTNASASTYAVGLANAIVVTGTDSHGNVITGNVVLTATGGGETISTPGGFYSVTSIAIPAQLGTGGVFTFGIGDLIFSPPARQVRGGAAGVIAVVTAGGAAGGQGASDLVPCLQGEHHDIVLRRIFSATTTAYPITVYG